VQQFPSATRKQSEQSLQKLGDLYKLQSNALNSLAYIWAGTRRWALAAAREAMVDKRLHSPEEAFLFELEEIKQLMTGEWNVSSLDEIRALTATRQKEQEALQHTVAPALLVGDEEAQATVPGLPVVAGKTKGPLRHWQSTHNLQHATPASGVIAASEYLDSGFALVLPLASAFVAESGTPCDPFAAAAHQWQRPVVVAMGQEFEGLADGAETVVDISAATVTVTQG
jgi:phosphohistidine swiveling domain-containing protein